MSLTKQQLLLSALTNYQYTKVSNFTDLPIPPQPFTQPTKSSLPPDLHTSLSRQNRVIKPILGDGNCFFCALSDIFYSSQEHHAKVRREIVDYITLNATKFAPLLFQETIGQHITSMKTSGKWATQVEIQAATKVYCAPIYLYTLTPSKKSYHWLQYTPRHASEPTITRHIELAHPLCVHFEVILDATTHKPSLTPPKLTGKSVHLEIS